MFKSATDSLTSFTIVWVPTPIGYSVAIRANVITNILTNIKSLCKTTPPRLVGALNLLVGMGGWQNLSVLLFLGCALCALRTLHSRLRLLLCVLRRLLSVLRYLLLLLRLLEGLLNG